MNIILVRFLSMIILSIYSSFALSPSLYLNKPIVTQGEFIIASLSLPKPPKKLNGLFFGKKIVFFKSGESNKYTALIGADVIADTGVHPLEVKGDYGDGKTFYSIEMIFVQEGNFKKENLKFGRTSDLEKKVQKRVYKEWLMMQSILNSGLKEPLWNGEFVYPINSKITSGFGNQRIFDRELQTVHTGVDFRAPVKTPIRTPNNGKIAFVGDLYYCGKTLLIDHGAGVFTQYCHLKSTKMKNGAFVKTGDVVALSGNSGRTTGPHLHWAIHVNGARVNPLIVKKYSKIELK